MQGACIHTATHAITCEATQEIEDVGFCGQFCQPGETTPETLETHGFGAQALSSNCLHVSVASVCESLELDSVVDINTNLRRIEYPRLDGMCASNDVVFQFCWVDAVFTPINTIEKGCGTSGNTYRRRCRETRRSRRNRRRNKGTRRRQNGWTMVGRSTTRCRWRCQQRLASSATRRWTT